VQNVTLGLIDIYEIFNRKSEISLRTSNMIYLPS
jgi:hypothetical protein